MCRQRTRQTKSRRAQNRNRKKNTLVNCNCTDSEIKGAGYTYTGKNPVGVTPIPVKSDWNWGDLPWEWLLFLLVSGLLIYFFYWLFSQRPERKIVNETQPPVQQTVHVPFVPEGYDLVKKGYVQLPEGSGYAPAGMSIVAQDKIVIEKNSIHLGERREGEVFAGQIGPMAKEEISITHNFSQTPKGEGWPNEKSQVKTEAPKNGEGIQ